MAKAKAKASVAKNIVLGVLVLVFAGVVIWTLLQYSKCAACVEPTDLELELREAMRRLWADHVYWTRIRIIALTHNLGEGDIDAERLFQNQGELAALFGLHLNPEAEGVFKNLLDAHLRLGDQLIEARLAGDQDTVETVQEKWRENMEEMAQFLADHHPDVWSLETVKELFRDHLDLTEAEALAYVEGNYEESIKAFDDVYKQALKIGDLMAKGLAKGKA